MAKVLRINRCEECPHFRLYDPNRDSNPDVGDAIRNESCSLTGLWIITPQLGAPRVPRPDGFPEWCPLEDPLCS